MTISYRQATVHDAQALAELAQRTFPSATPDFIAPEEIEKFTRKNLSVEVFEAWLGHENTCVLIAEDEKFQAVGYTLSFLGKEPEQAEVAANLENRPTMEISKCYVVDELHGAGISQELMTRTLRYGAQQGARGVWLGMNKENTRAHKFYKKFGFDRILGERLFEIGGQYCEDYLLEAQLGVSLGATEEPSTKAPVEAV